MHFTYTDKDILDGRFEFRQSGTFRVLSQFAQLKIAIACIFEVMFALYTLSVLFNGGAASNNTSIIIIKIALAVILPMCAGKWGLAGRLRWWSGCGAIGRLRWPGYGRPTYISRGVRYTVNG